MARTRLPAQPGGPRPIAWRAWENYLSPLAPRITWRHGAAHPGRRSPGSGEPAGMSRERAEDPRLAKRPAARVCYTPHEPLACTGRQEPGLAPNWRRASRAGPLPLEGVRERFLPECTFRGRHNTKLRYAALAAAALHGGDRTGPAR